MEIMDDDLHRTHKKFSSLILIHVRLRIEPCMVNLVFRIVEETKRIKLIANFYSF